MNRPPRLSSPRHRKWFPGLIVAAGMLASTAQGGPATIPQETPNDPVSAAGAILLRRYSASGTAADAWLQALKARTLPAKKTPVSPPGKSHRLIVKFHDDLMARLGRSGRLAVNPDHAGKAAALKTLAAAMKLRFRSFHTIGDEALDALRKRAALSSGVRQPDLAATMEVIAANDSPAVILAAAKALLALDAVEYVEIQSLDAPPPPPAADLLPATPPMVSYQTYRGQAQGIGADFARDQLGIRGHPDLRVTDCEYRYNPLHEDLAGLITLQPGVAAMYGGFGDNHGTAAIGILTAADNEYGMTGAAPLCQTHFYPEYATMDDGSVQFRAATVTAAIAASAPGDIVVLEMQTRAADGKYCPAEYDMSVWNAVKTGTDAGVIIVAAAGNNDCNLDSLSWAEYRSRGDSGAIIVGAGNASRARLSYSAYGSRVNVQGWGEGVATTGYGNLMSCGNDPNQNYTNTFSGTSSATAVVAAAAAVVQSASIERLGTRLSPLEMRSLLVATGNPQTGETYRPIGPLPDLTAALPHLLARQFANTTPIDIPDAGLPAAPPSSIQVTGVDDLVTAVRVRLDGLNHGSPQNLDLLLVSPDGKVAALMCDAGRSFRAKDTLLMFDDSASTEIPGYTAIVPGRYRPANHGTDQEIPPPGTTGPIGTKLTDLAENGANGEWKLYIADDHEGDTGSIAGWSISFETKPYPVVSLTSDTLHTSEGDEAIAITATLNEAAPVEVAVPIILSGDASATADYQIPAGPIIIPAGESTGSTVLAPIDDAIAEADETIIISVGTPSHATTGDAATETIILEDNDVTLTIESDAGPPPPSMAGGTYTIGSEVTVTGPDFDNGEGTRHVCVSWTGSGSVPASGQGCTAAFVIQENSHIHWHHSTEHRLELSTTGTGTVDVESGWLLTGATPVLTAQPASGHQFAGWTVSMGSITQGSPQDPAITVEMTGPVSLTANFLPDPVGVIALEAASGPHPANGGACDFGRLVTGTGPLIRSFTMRNTGDATLHGIRLLPGGSTAFALAQAPIPDDLAPGDSAGFSLSFDPQAAQTFNGLLLIECDDPAAAPFVLNLSGTGATAREQYEDWLATAGLAPNDGVPDLLQYAFNLTETAPGQRSLAGPPASAGLPCLTCLASEPAPVFRLAYLRRKLSGLAYSALQMDDPASGTRTPMTGTETVTEIDSEWERVTIEQVLDPENPRRFFTVEVILPDP